jgi:hypothetical protein
MSTWQENRRAAELAKLRAELVRRLDQLDFRSRASAWRSRGLPGRLNTPSGG